jgi:hypothetical protein
LTIADFVLVSQNFCLKTMDLVLQILVLVYMLEAALLESLIYSYALLITTNVTSFAVTIWLGMGCSAFYEVLVDSM